MINSIIRYFDLQAESRDRSEGQAGLANAPLKIPVFLQYIATAAGVVADPYLHSYLATGQFNVTWNSLWLRIVFSLMIGLVLLPAVYRASFDPDKPTLVQLAALFVSGLGWQSLFAAATKAAVGN